MVNVELVYAAKDKRIFHCQLVLAVDACVADAIDASQIVQTFPEAKDLPVGIYAQRVTGDTVLKEGDRIEIYRPLDLEPKEKRRQRAGFKVCAPSAPERRSKNTS